MPLNCKKTFILLFLALAAYGQQQERVAIINTMDNNDSIGFNDLSYLTDRLRETAVNVLPESHYGIMTTESIVAFLGSQERAVKVCKEASCLAELGRMVSADYVAQANIGRFNNNLTIKTELYSVKKGNLINSFTGESKNLAGLLVIINEKAPILFKKLDKRLYSVKLSTEPSGADLSFDGDSQSSCTTPCKVELQAGNVRITADLEDYETADTTVSIKQNNQSILIRLKPNFGILEVKPAYSDGIGKDEQWSLTLNGQSFSSLENKLPADKYKGELSHRCYEDISFNIGVSKGKRQVFDMAKQVKLKKGGLVLKAEKNGEPVFVNGKQAGKTPFSGSVPLCAVVEVGKGRERVDVELEYNGRVEYTHEYAYVILFNRGVEYYKKGNYDLAIEDFNAALRIKPNDYETLRYRGITYRNKGNYDRAIEDFNAALRIKPNDQDALIGRGLAYGLKDNHDRAIEDFNTVLKIKPNDQDALYWRGCVYYNKGNYDKALEDFNAAIRIKPDYQNALYWRGLTYGKKSNYDKAIEDFNTAIKIKPNDQDALLNRGVMYAKKGNHDRAIEDYNAALRIKPDYNIALYSRGYAYYYKGNYDRAIEDLEAILKIDPNDAIARENLEKIRQSKVETKSNIKFFTDNRDGKKYRTVTIGRKTWMAENLNYNVSGSKCYNNNSAYCDKYGRLYDWTMAKVVCPQGWHLPSNAEWQAIVDFAGGNIAGKNLKAKNDWDYGTDIYDFSALPGGYINSRGYFTNAGSTGSWWSSSEFNASNAFNQYIDSSERVIGNYNIKSSLRSVRCVQN